MSSVAAGWYPSPENPKQNRYWDGTQWTHHVAPAAPPVVPTAAPAPAPASAAYSTPPTYSSPPAYSQPAAPAFPPPPANAAPGTVVSSPKKKLLIGGAIVAGVIVVSSVSAAIGGANRGDEPVVQASTAPVVVEETEAPAEPTPTPTAAPSAEPVEPPVVDAVAFRAQANSHLDDMLKDLDDMVVTVQEAGFWRLLSNSGELAFNLGQLEALDVPTNVATTWPDSTAALDTALDALSDAVSTQDGPTILAAIEVVRAQVEASRGVANTAQAIPASTDARGTP